MSAKITIELDDESDACLLLDFLKSFAPSHHGWRTPDLPHQVPNTFLDVVQVNSVVEPDTPLILFNPMSNVDNGFAQTYAVNLYTTPANQPYSFDGTGVQETLLIPRIRPFNGSTQAPTSSVLRQIQTTGPTVVQGLPTLTGVTYFMTFTVVIPGYEFRMSIPFPAPSTTPAYPNLSQIASNCVAEDIQTNKTSRILQVSYSADPTDYDYFVWRKVTLGGGCDPDGGAPQNLFLQWFG